MDDDGFYDIWAEAFKCKTQYSLMSTLPRPFIIVNGLENLIQYCLQLNQSRVWPKNIEFETFFYDAQKAIHHKHWAWKRDRVLIAIESILILTST